jgi:FkbM family methyltransferase
MRSLLRSAQAVFAYGDVMQSPVDVARYARLRAAYARARSGAPRVEAPPVALRLKALGGHAVLCRASQDVWTLKYTFLSQFHLPPVPLSGGAIIVDLGSNVGYTVAHLAHLYPTARVIGVEMDADNFALAERNTAAFGDRVRLVHAAVWTHDGEIAYEGEGDDAFAVSGDAPAGAATTVRSAPARRLDRILDEHGIHQVDYLKMDIEGAESAILADPDAWIGRVRSMKIEIHPPATFDSLRGVLESNGFTCSRDSRHWDCLVAVRA